MGFRLIGGPEGGRVRLSPYRPEWAERFAAEREWADINDYADAKGALIAEILERAR